MHFSTGSNGKQAAIV